MIGERFGRLKVLAFAGRVGRRLTWQCHCDCGTIIAVRNDHLRGGNTKSCGCLQRENTKVANRTHGNHKAPEYGVWDSMLSRCRRETHKQYHDYGGRGIKVCARWDEFAAFFANMGARPSPTHTLDRIDNTKGYEPGNCRWATRVEQSRNCRKRRDNSSGVTGVYWDAHARKWRAGIGHKGRFVYIGLFDDIASAAAARKAKATELGFNPDHGERR